LEERLKFHFGIDLAEQPYINRELARIGSMNDDLVTIDLSSASDTIGYKMLQDALPRETFMWFDFLRSPSVQLPDGSVEKLHMISSMGNGFTFPLETVIFTCVVAAVYRIMGIPMKRTQYSWDLSPRELAHRTGLKRRFGHEFKDELCQARWEYGNFGVFGDDIIVTKEASRLVCRLLRLLGFQVNSDKSFFEGPFRESCGGDFFQGVPTRGVYIKSLRSMASRYVAINRLNEWSAVTGIQLPRAVRYLVKTVRKIYVPLHEADDAGIKVASRLVSYLQCEVTGKPHIKSEPIFGTVLYKRWAPIPSQLEYDPDQDRIFGYGRRRHVNADGLLTTFLRGDIERYRWGVRNDNPRYRPQKALSLYWDRVVTGGKQFPVDTIALARAIEANIC